MFTWDELERKYNMKLKQPPLRLSGGLMHKMYKLETDQGIYALKLLNPFIMQREDAMENYREAERLESILEQKKIPILPVRCRRWRDSIFICFLIIGELY